MRDLSAGTIAVTVKPVVPVRKFGKYIHFVFVSAVYCCAGLLEFRQLFIILSQKSISEIFLISKQGSPNN